MFFKKFISFLTDFCHNKETKSDVQLIERVRNPKKITINKQVKKNREIMKGKEKKKEKKVAKVMHEFEAGKLHSGSKKGPVVKSPKQAIAIGLSEAKKGKK
jgi:glycyl-tRNA synthetase (class II)